MRILFVLPVLLSILSCNPDSKIETKTPVSTSLFTPLPSQQTGLKFANMLNEDIMSTNNIFFFEYYYHGGGVAIGDINNDGLSDVFLTSNTGQNKLFLNEGNLEFKDITKNSGLAVAKYWSTGAVMVDINNDGLLDIYVCQAGPYFKEKHKRRNSLYINKGKGKFSEEAEKYGLNDANLSTQASFFDFDKDGDLDCFIINESEHFRVDFKKIVKNVIPFKDRLVKQSCKMLENRNGKFVDITAKSGLLDFSFGLGLVTSDFNNDGWTDIYVANDYSVPDFLYINQKNGKFKESIKRHTKHSSWFSMGVDYNDINNDGWSDLAVVDMASPDHFTSKVFMASMNVENFNYNKNVLKRHPGYMFNALQLNNGNSTFSNIAGMAGVQKTEWSWSNLLADFDNDGYKDYFIATGNRRNYQHNDVRRKILELKKTLKKPIGHPELVKVYNNLSSTKTDNKIFRNTGDLKFEDVTEDWGLNYGTFSNGAAYADLDNDGDLDLIVNNIDDEVSLLRNNSETLKNNHFLKFEFPKSANSYNGKVKLFMDNGEILTQEYMPTRGFCSSVEHKLHFGLGKDSIVPKIEVNWPSGLREVKNNVKANQLIALKEGSWSKAKQNSVQTSVMKAIRSTDIGLDYRHRENDFDDYEKQVLLPFRHSTVGPAITKGDYNGDGFEDVFIGGASGQVSELWFQNKEGEFKQQEQNIFNLSKEKEVVDLKSFDFDNDSDLDILVVNGGYEFYEGCPKLVDELYINNGLGEFKKASKNIFPELKYNGSKAAISDIDNDGDLDVFIGGRVIPNEYPKAEVSYVLKNEKGKFKIDKSVFKTEDLGIVRDVRLKDLDGDNFPELITVGDWEMVTVYNNINGHFEKSTTAMEDEYSGWWSALEVFDIDNDGDMDLLVGNVGENTKYKIDETHVLNVHADDFDKNGTYDIVLSKSYKNKEVPIRGLQCLSEQVPSVKSKFNTYVDFANADLDAIIGEGELKKGLSKTLNFVKSGVFVNNNGQFEFRAFPNIAQVSPINKFILEDVNNDGIKDIILGGNMNDTEVETPCWDAGNGLVLINKSNANKIDLDPLTVKESGFFAPRDLRDMIVVNSSAGNKKLFVLNNDSKMQVFNTPIK